MEMNARERQGHVAQDLASRNLKALKIARLIGTQPSSGPLDMLEIGTGSGGIAHFFGAAGTMGWHVESVDVQDHRLVTDGYRFSLVEGVRLPFPDASFDVVVSNHVIEHVGNAHDQVMHLSELRRVLRPEGRGYVAVPNRWAITEPHYRLPFLSWLPSSLADAYVRLAGKGTYYDCRPLGPLQLERMLNHAGFRSRQCSADAIRLMFELERGQLSRQLRPLAALPAAFWEALRHQLPTLIYVLAKAP